MHPRLERFQNDPFPSIDVLERLSNFPSYIELIDQYSNSKSYDLSTFIWYGFLDEVISDKGYKVDLESQVDPIKLELRGSILDPSSYTTLLPEQDNWVGYFIDYPQLPKDFMDDDDWAVINEIKARTWAMVRVDSDPPYWKIKGKVTPVEYGEMISIRVDSEFHFSWIASGEEVMATETSELQYYSIEEQSDYLPVFVEFDENSDVQEVALLADNEIVGAAVREPNDTIVQINAYIQDMNSGVPLEIESWDGYKSTSFKSGDYLVFNSSINKKEKRKIFTGEKTRYHIVSLDLNDEYVMPDILDGINISPNPFQKNVEISFRLNHRSTVSIDIFDLEGQKVFSIVSIEDLEGVQSFIWNGNDNNGNPVNNGIYFLLIRIDETRILKKIVKIVH